MATTTSSGIHYITSEHRRKELCVSDAPATLSSYFTCSPREEKQENYLKAKQRSGRTRSGSRFMSRFLQQHINFISGLAPENRDSCKCCFCNAFNFFQLLSLGQGEAKVFEVVVASWQHWIGVLFYMLRYNVRRVLSQVNILPRLSFQSKSVDYPDTGEQGKSKIRMFMEDGLQICFVLCGGTTRTFIVRYWYLLQCCMMGMCGLCSNCFGCLSCWVCWGAQRRQKPSNKLRRQDLMEIGLVRQWIGRWGQVFLVLFMVRCNGSRTKKRITTTIATTTTTRTITTTIEAKTKRERRGEEVSPTTTAGGSTARKTGKLKSNASKDKEMAQAGVKGGKQTELAQEVYSNGTFALLKKVPGEGGIEKESEGQSQAQTEGGKEREGKLQAEARRIPIPGESPVNQKKIFALRIFASDSQKNELASRLADLYPFNGDKRGLDGKSFIFVPDASFYANKRSVKCYDNLRERQDHLERRLKIEVVSDLKAEGLDMELDAAGNTLRHFLQSLLGPEGSNERYLLYNIDVHDNAVKFQCFPNHHQSVTTICASLLRYMEYALRNHEQGEAQVVFLNKLRKCFTATARDFAASCEWNAENQTMETPADRHMAMFMKAVEARAVLGLGETDNNFGGNYERTERVPQVSLGADPEFFARTDWEVNDDGRKMKKARYNADVMVQTEATRNERRCVDEEVNNMTQVGGGTKAKQLECTGRETVTRRKLVPKSHEEEQRQRATLEDGNEREGKSQAEAHRPILQQAATRAAQGGKAGEQTATPGKVPDEAMSASAIFFKQFS